MCGYIVSYICAEPFASFHQDKAIGKPSKRGTQQNVFCVFILRYPNDL